MFHYNLDFFDLTLKKIDLNFLHVWGNKYLEEVGVKIHPNYCYLGSIWGKWPTKRGSD